MRVQHVDGHAIRESADSRESRRHAIVTFGIPEAITEGWGLNRGNPGAGRVKPTYFRFFTCRPLDRLEKWPLKRPSAAAFLAGGISEGRKSVRMRFRLGVAFA